MKQKVALVLSGGGARGIAHIGVIDELEKRGYKISSVAGTSMGSLIGGVYAAGKLEEFKAWTSTLDKGKLFLMADFALSRQGLIKGERLFRKMKDFIPDILIEDLDIPYAAVAADLVNKEEVVFRDGSLWEAIRASIAIPSVFTPVKSRGRLLVDGGVMNNIPINRVQRNDGDILVAVNVIADVPVRPGGEIPKEGGRNQRVHKKGNNKDHADKMSYFSLITSTIDLMTMQMSDLCISNYIPDILVNVSSEACHVFDFHKIEEMVETGRLAAVEALNHYDEFCYNSEDK